MRVHGLAGDQQLHDFRGPLEDPVDPHVAELLLGRHGAFAAGLERVRGLKASAAADLHQFVGDPEANLAGPQLGQRRLDPDVLLPGVGHSGGQFKDGVQGESAGGDEGDLLAHRLMLADGLAPLDAGVGPFAGDLQAPFAASRAERGDGEPAGVQRGEGDFQALPFTAQPVGRGDPDLVETGDAVFDAAEAHEGVAVFHRDAGGVHFHHER